MSRTQLALSSFCVFMGISLLMLAALVAPQRAWADACETDCYSKECQSKCQPYPNSQACKDCIKACQDKCAQGGGGGTICTPCAFFNCFKTSQADCSKGNSPLTGKCLDEIGACLCTCEIFYDETALSYCKCQ